jgi:hypothetical protein
MGLQVRELGVQKKVLKRGVKTLRAELAQVFPFFLTAPNLCSIQRNVTSNYR